MFKHLPPKIVYVRHPECLHNVNRLQAIEHSIPNRESPLTERGIRQCEYTAQYLKEQESAFDAVFCSEYARTHAIPRSAGFSYTVAPQLNERDMGVWHYMPEPMIESLYPGERERLNQIGYYAYSAPEGESCGDVDARLIAFLEESERFLGIERMLISGHGVSGLCLRRLLTGETLDMWHHWHDDKEHGRMRNASVSIFEKKPGERFYQCTLFGYCPWEGREGTRVNP